MSKRTSNPLDAMHLQPSAYLEQAQDAKGEAAESKQQLEDIVEVRVIGYDRWVHVPTVGQLPHEHTHVRMFPSTLRVPFRSSIDTLTIQPCHLRYLIAFVAYNQTKERNHATGPPSYVKEILLYFVIFREQCIQLVLLSAFVNRHGDTAA